MQTPPEKSRKAEQSGRGQWKTDMTTESRAGAANGRKDNMKIGKQNGYRCKHD